MSTDPYQDRREDIAWMAEHHETPREVARRLGLSLNTLEAWCRRSAPDLLEQLRENEARRKGMVA